MTSSVRKTPENGAIEPAAPAPAGAPSDFACVPLSEVFPAERTARAEPAAQENERVEPAVPAEAFPDRPPSDAASDPAGEESAEYWQSKRRHPRYTLPLNIEINGVRYEVEEWSLGGFSVNAIQNLGLAGDRADVRVIIEIEGFDLSFRTKAEVVRLDTQTRSAAFRFCDLDDSHVGTLSRISSAMLSGRISNVDGMLRYVDAQAGKATPDAEARIDRWAAWRRRAALAAGILLCVVAARAALLQTLSVHAVAAWPANPAITLTAPSSARVAQASVEEGQSVLVGDPLIVLEDRALQADLAFAEAEQARLSQRLEGLDAMLTGRRSMLATEREAAEAVLARTQARRDVAERAMRAARDFHQARVDLHARGIVPLGDVVDAERARLETENTLAEAERDHDQALSRRNAAQAGVFYGNGRTTGLDPAALELEIGEVQQLLSLQDVRIEGLRRQQADNRLTSPCDCVVEDIAVQPGETLAVSDPVILLRPQAGAGEIVAFLRHDNARRLEIGQRATVRLANGRTDTEARIAGIGSVRHANGQALLARNLNPERFTELRIVLSDPYRDAPLDGADVVIVNDAVGWLERLLFFDL